MKTQQQQLPITVFLKHTNEDLYEDTPSPKTLKQMTPFEELCTITMQPLDSLSSSLTRINIAHY